jgi:hypothetical protein
VTSADGPDLRSTEAFSDFIETKPKLIILNDAQNVWGNALREMKSRPITDLPNNTQFYLNSRALGFTWYDSLNLPDSDTTDYFVSAIFQLSHSNNKRGATFIPILDSSPAYIDLNAIAGTPAEKRGIYFYHKPMSKSTLYNTTSIDLPQSRNTPQTVPIPSASLIEPTDLVQSSDTSSPVVSRPVVRRSPRVS